MLCILIQIETVNDVFYEIKEQDGIWTYPIPADWSNDIISDYEFLDGIYWFIDNGKVQLD